MIRAHAAPVKNIRNAAGNSIRVCRAFMPWLLHVCLHPASQVGCNIFEILAGGGDYAAGLFGSA